MPDSTDSSEPQHGNIVAIEGNADMVATQLRLLPQSTKILIIPALSTALPPIKAEPFDALRWVRHVQDAFVARSETARSFLKSSNSMQPRLVFLNGGSVSARVECIQRIAEQMTNGRIDEAEAIFNDIVKDGVAGLLRPDDIAEDVMVQPAKSPSSVYPEEDRDENSPDLRGAIAMEAADRLDNQTVEFQSPAGNGMFSQSRAEDHDPGDHKAHCRQNEEEITNLYAGDIKKTVIILPDGLADREIPTTRSKRSTFGVLPATTYSPDPPRSFAFGRESTYELDGEGDESEDVLSIGDRSEITPGIIEVGQAQVIRVEAKTSPRHLRSVMSMDRFKGNPGALGNRRRSRSLTPKVISASAVAHRMAALKGYGHGRRASLSDLEKAPEPSFVRAISTTIKKAPGKTSANSSATPSPRRIYVDRGTDAGPILRINTKPPPTPDTVSGEYNGERPPFEPVFPVFEDLVIHFTDGADNSLLESVIRSYKNGGYPVMSHSRSGFTSSESSPTNSPQSSNGLREERMRQLFGPTTEYEDFGYQVLQKSNPFTTEDSRPRSRQHRFPHRQGASIENPPVISPAPLSPAATPPPTRSSVAQRFHRVSSIDNNKTATGIQNSLRAVLNIHFPPELTNYRQYSVPVDSDRLWKPVFRDSDGHTQEGRTVDQIIAVGAEDGVNSNFLNEIAGQVERLGSKKNGTTRSGKLDMRFLIASAMQTFTKQSLLYQSQSSSSPFSSPMLLASLLVPQLETYLASNVSTRLLIIQYSASHLPTILALRHIVGADTFKIAAILNSLAAVPLLNSFPSSPLGVPTVNRLSNVNVAAYNSRTRAAPRPVMPSISPPKSSKSHSPVQSIEFKYNSSEPLSTSFSRANYLLPSTATDVEIASFLTSITNHLIEKSSYYTPEPVLHSNRKRSGGLGSPVTPIFAPHSNNTSATSRKSGTTAVSNSSRPMTPHGRGEREIRVGQAINSNIIRSPQGDSDDAANSSSKKTYPNLSTDTELSGLRAVSSPKSTTSSTFHVPTNSFQALPKTTSTSSSISIISRPKTATSPPPITTATVFESNPPKIQPLTMTSNHTTQTSISLLEQHSRSNTNGNIITTTTTTTSSSTRPTTAEARERQSERDWANFYMGDSEEEDEIDRILMPRVPRRMEKRKGNSRKALKWLGLA